MKQVAKKWIGVLDCNNFFVSCERLFRPDLHGKPVVVLSSNDGCIVARSQEIKDMGIPMGVPYFQIKDILKKADATTFSSHFALYRDISRRVFAVMREELQTIEQYSIDEAFFVVEKDPEQVARRVKAAVERQVGIPVSVGVAHSKTQAKYANTVAKKTGGVCVLDEQSWQSLTNNIPLSTLWGVGGRLEIQYKSHNLFTVADLLAADPARIAQIFGVGGVRLRQELQGRSVFHLHAKAEPQKSIMSSRSFKDTTDDKAVLADAVAYHVRHAVADLRSMGLQARAIRVSIQPSRHGDFVLRGGSFEAVLPIATDDTFVLLRAANDLLEHLFESGVPYKKAGITLTQITPASNEQVSLFEDMVKHRTQSLMPLIDAINSKRGSEVVLFGSRLRTQSWQSRTDVRSPAYTTRWKDIAGVTAK